jgi:hypothetical protein
LKAKARANKAQDEELPPFVLPGKIEIPALKNMPGLKSFTDQ